MRPFTPKKPSKLWHSQVAAAEDDQQPKQVQKATKATVGNFMLSRSTKPLTMPIEFNFSSRLDAKKKLAVSAATAVVKPKIFKDHNSEVTTVPKPFRFQTDKAMNRRVYTSAAMDDSRSPYMSTSERVRMYNRTPSRFKSTAAAVKPSQRSRSMSLTRPKSPKFATRTRIGRKIVPSTEERELEELKARSQFKARPLDVRVLNSHGDLGVPKVEKAPLTVAASPMFSKLHTKPAQEPVIPEQFKAHEYKPSVPFEPRLQHRKLAVEDFHLPGSPISRAKKQQIEHKVQQEAEQKRLLTQFHAQPVLEPRTASATNIEAKPVTLPQSPALKTKIRGAAHKEKFGSQLEQQQKENLIKTNFQARPVLISDPFYPKMVNKPVTETRPFVMHSETRAQERKKFEESVIAHKKTEQRIREEQAMEQKNSDEKLAKAARLQTVFSARPILHAPVPFEPRKSDKPLTEPVSPYISSKGRGHKKM